MIESRESSLLEATSQQVTIVAGKGGVGKSTVSVASALANARAGRSVILLSTDISTITARAEREVAARDEYAANSPVFQLLRAEEILIEYLETHGLASLGKRLISTGVVSVIATAVPGIRELLILAKIKQLAQSGDYDRIIFDAPASGHLMTLLSSPTGLKDIAKVGLLKNQSDDVEELLNDRSRSGLTIVTLPEETPVTESIETISKIRELKSIAVNALVVNQRISAPKLSPAGHSAICDSGDTSPSARAYEYVTARERVADAEMQRLIHGITDVEILELPYLFQSDLSITDLEELKARKIIRGVNQR
ncbi:MAG: ArsA family ATPase [Actinomycetota bacterium]|nr:ArsA family ATPase [Actinomycetota bacterium]